MENTQSRILTCSPWTPNPCVQEIEVRAACDKDGVLRVTYILIGTLFRLRIPLHGSSIRGDQLWKHTCFETFIACPGEAAYHEFNFSPSQEWAAYGYRRYRERDGWTLEMDPCIQVEVSNERLVLDATIPLRALSLRHLQAPVRLGLAAMIEDEAGVLSYWALRHPPGRPDFHHVDGFDLVLDAPQPGGQNAGPVSTS
jgi:hypothetical protein